MELARSHHRLGDNEAAERVLRDGLEKAIEPRATYVTMRGDATTTRVGLEVALADLLAQSIPDGADQAKQNYEDAVEIREQGLGTDNI